MPFSLQSQLLKEGNSNNSKSIVKIQQFTEEYLQPVSTLVTKGFSQMNKLWLQYGLPYEQARKVIRGRMIPSLHCSYVLLQDGILRGAVLQHDITKLMKDADMPHRLEYFNISSRAIGLLLEKLHSQSIKSRGEAVYGTYGVIDPQHSNKGLSKYFWWRVFAEMKLSGYKFFCCCVTNPISLKILSRFGAKIIAQTFFQSGCIKEKFWMMKLDLTKFSMSYKQFVKVMNEGKVRVKDKIKPKL